jgi:phosphoglycerol transferase MdoB-like AlkP superfamily enzyme
MISHKNNSGADGGLQLDTHEPPEESGQADEIAVSGELTRSQDGRPYVTRSWANARAAAGDACYWIIPALVALYAKYVILIPGRGLEIAQRAMAQSSGLTESEIGRWHALSFFRMDLLVGCILVPAAYFLVAVILPRKWSSRIAWTSSAILALMIYIQIQAMETTGSYISLHTLRVAVSWGLHEPLANTSFLSWGIVAVVCVLALSSPMITGVLQKRMQGRDAATFSHRSRLLLRRFGLAIAICAVAVTALAWAPASPATVFHRSAMIVALRAYLDAGPVEVGKAQEFAREMAALTIPQLEERYRELVHAPSPARDATYWAKAQGYNVIFFVLETTPTRFLSVTGDLDAFPNLRQLREQSFVPTQHYTTFPVTHRALYSLFGSLYPSPGDLSLPEKHAKVALPGMFRALAAKGYQTAAYMPFRWNGEYDDQMFEMLGVNRLIYPDAAIFSNVVGASNAGKNWREARFQRDRSALALMEKDLTDWLSHRTNFAAVFLPQVGHVPLPLPDGDAPRSESQVLSQEKTILQAEDAWLGDLVQLLKSHNELEHTLIIVTGDHGIRVANEDPVFTPGLIDDYSFQVPFLLYAPGVLKQTKWIPWVTSHIDVPPTVLDLLGIDGERELMEGAPLWTPGIAGRSTYFFASRLLGADGYQRDGNFFMWNESSGFAYANPRLHFNILDPLPQYSGRSSKIVESVSQMSSLQQALEDKLAASYPPH